MSAEGTKPKIASDRFQYTPRIVILTLFLFCGGTLLCTGIFYLGLDFVCVNDAQTWIPPYPDAEVVSEDYNFLRPFGVGITQIQLYTTDARQDIVSWYGQARSGLGINATSLATMNYTISEADDGEGHIISLSSECAWR